jgi:hypothetical protein
MAAPTRYFYNSTKFPLTIQADTGIVYYAQPRSYIYLTSEVLGGFILPDGIVSFALPNWWSPSYWPDGHPWDISYNAHPDIRV